MGGLLEPNLNPTTERQESSLRPILIGIVIIFAVFSGLVFGGFRYMRHRSGAAGDAESVISLHLGDQ